MDITSFLFVFLLNLKLGSLADAVIKEILGYRIPIFSIFLLGLLSFLLYLDIQLLFLLNVCMITFFIIPLYIVVNLELLEQFFISNGASTFTTFIMNNFRIIFLKKCEQGEMSEIKIILAAHNILTSNINFNLLNDGCFKQGIINSSINNHSEILELILSNYNLSNVVDKEFLNKLLLHVSRLGYFNIFKILVNSNGNVINDSEFYRVHNLKVKIDEATKYLKEEYSKSIEILEIKKCDSNDLFSTTTNEVCMICHDTHAKIIMLKCKHYICLESLFSYYNQHPSEELKCFICGTGINFKDCVSFSKL